MQSLPPAELGPADNSIPHLPGRSAETLTLDLARADTPDGALRLRLFCRKTKQDGASALTDMILRQAQRKDH